MKKYFAVGILLLACLPASAWDDGGHMLVAQIAYSQLDSNAKRLVNDLLNSLPDERKNTPSFKPRAYNFVSAACWMDDMRGVAKYDTYRTWHYINVPCGKEPRDVKLPNALGAIEYSARVLRSKRFGAQSKAKSLAILLHVGGDIHQPLHSIDKDLGGNTFPISGVPGIAPRIRQDGRPVQKAKPPSGGNKPVYQRLHAFWDSAYRYDLVKQGNGKNVAQLYYLGNSARPNTASIQTIAADLTAHYLPQEAGVLHEMDAAQWIAESNGIACSLAFATPRKRRPSQVYFKQAHDASCRRLALAGHRLAKLLNEIFADAKTHGKTS